MAKKTAKGLVEYAKAMLGKPYWYGTYGNTSSKELYEYKKKQYPRYYTARDFASQYGERVHDCVGLIKGYLWSDSTTSKPKYNAEQDKSANGMYNVCKEKGNINHIPEIEGLLVWRSGHIGVYIGGGYVIEARGHSYGVVKTRLKDRNFTNWCKCPYIEYGEVTEQAPVKTEKKTNAEIAQEVFAGKWGVGDDRKKRIEDAGYDYRAVQDIVNELDKINRIAKEVIAGKWGTGQNRKDRLTKAGYDYNAVQKRVNQII